MKSRRFSENYICLYLFVEKRDIQTVFHSKVHDLVLNKQLESRALAFCKKKTFYYAMHQLMKTTIMTESKYEIKDWFEFTRFLFFPFSCTIPLFLLLDIFENWFFSCKKKNKLSFDFVCSKTSLFSNEQGRCFKKLNICSFKWANMFVFSYLFIQQSLHLLYPVFHPFLLLILVLIHCSFLPVLKLISFWEKKQNFWNQNMNKRKF